MAPWNVNFKVAPQAEFIWGVAGSNLVDSNGFGLDNGTSLYTFTRNYTLENPAALTFSIWVDDHCDLFMNNKFIGPSGDPVWMHRDVPNSWDTFSLGVVPAGDLSFIMRCSNARYRAAAGVLAALTDSAGNVLLVTDREWRVSFGDNRVTISPDDIAASEYYSAGELSCCSGCVRACEGQTIVH